MNQPHVNLFIHILDLPVLIYISDNRDLKKGFAYIYTGADV